MAKSGHHLGSSMVVAVAAAIPDSTGTGLLVRNIVESGIVTADLPTADPHLKGALWSSSGTWTISQG